MTVTDEGPHSPPEAAPQSPGELAPQRASTAVREVCPYLHAATGAWRSTHAAREHRCGAIEPPARLAVAKQRSLCLLPAHATCATFLAACHLAAASGRPAREDDGPDLWPATRSVPLVLEPARGLLTPLAGGGTWTGGQALLVALMVLAFLVLVVARTSAPPTAGAPSAVPLASAAVGVASPSAVPSAAPATPSPTTSSAPSPSSPPSVAPTAAPTAAPTTAPTASPATGGTRYRVKSGDTLTTIAARFHTTVKALKAANGISNGSVIHPGQVLVIP